MAPDGSASVPSQGQSSNDEGPPSVGVKHINLHGQEHHEGVLECRWREDKGRVLHAMREWEEGEVILIESPLHVVQQEEKCGGYTRLKQLCKEHHDDFDYEPLWYWCALQSLTQDQLADAKEGGWSGTTDLTQKNLLLLHHDTVEAPGSAAEILVRELAPSADPIIIERLIQVWVLNCFEFSDEPEGYSTYFFSSFMSHSCFPNSVWHYADQNHVLRARRKIRVGDEVCISYLAEHVLLQSAPMRRMELYRSKRFWCACERCAGDLDYSRGFLCPACSKGRLFAQCPDAGPAKDATLLAAHLEGASCSSCSYTVDGDGAKKLSRWEQKLQDIVDDLSRRAEERRAAGVAQKELHATEEFIGAHFTQHVLADSAWEQLAALCRDRADRLRLLEKRCDFYEKAYPGLNGAHAWAIEALADAWAGAPAPLRKGSTPKREDQEEALRLFASALEILRLMFGEDHEYVTDVEQKRADVQRAHDGGKSAAAASS